MLMLSRHLVIIQNITERQAVFTLFTLAQGNCHFRRI